MSQAAMIARVCLRMYGGTPDRLTLADAARITRDAVKDKSYQLYPIGQEAAAYPWVKRKRLTDSSRRDYERGLDKPRTPAGTPREPRRPLRWAGADEPRGRLDAGALS